MVFLAVNLAVFNRDGSRLPACIRQSSGRPRGRNPLSWFRKPVSSTTIERTFVVRDSNGRAQWIDVLKGALDGDLREVQGSLQAGDPVVRRASDEIREGTLIK